MSPKDTIWEANFKVDIPEFHGGFSSDSLIDWLVEIEEIWEFQSVSDDLLVSLVVKKFRGYATSWWHQVKTKRKQAGKSPIKSWAKLKQKLCAHFLPRHYGSLVYNRLQKLKRGTRVLVDYEDNCHFHENYFIDKPNHGIYNDKDNELSPMAYVADPKVDVIVAEEGDIVNFVDDIMDVTKSHKDLINTNDTDDDGDVADRDGHDDQILNGDTSLDVTDVDDQIDSVKTILDVKNVAVFDPAYDGGQVEVQNIEFIESQGVDFKKISSRGQAHVFNFCEKDEDSYMNKGKHDYSIYLTNRHRKINSEPPDRGRSEILFVHTEVDLHNKIGGSLVSDIYTENINLCDDDSHGEDRELIEVKVREKSKILEPFRHLGLIREDFHVSYERNLKEDKINMCMSTTEFLNWGFEQENLLQIPACPQRDVSGEDVMEVSYVATNSMCFLLNTDEALVKKTCEGRKVVANVCSARWLQECLTLVVMGSFNVVRIAVDMSDQILHHRKNFVNVKSKSARVVVMFLHHAWPTMSIVSIISFTMELQCGAFNWVIGAVLTHLDSCYISTTFICWSNVACESRKLLICGKLSLVFACFSTTVRFLVGKETTNVLVVALMWKLLDLSLDMNSSYRTPTKIFGREFMNKVCCLLGANLTCRDARWWKITEVTNAYIYGEVVNYVTELQGLHQRAQMVVAFSASKFKASNFKRRDMAFVPGDLMICVLFAKDRLPPHEYQQVSKCSPKIEISTFIFYLETFGIRDGDTWILSTRDKISKETKDLLVTRVQGSLEATSVLSKALYGGSFSKLHLRRKKKGHEVLMRKYYELVDKGYLQRFKIRVESF